MSSLVIHPKTHCFHLHLVSNRWADSAQKGKDFPSSTLIYSVFWLTLHWTCPGRFPAILALLFQHTCTTCLLDLVPSQHAASPTAFATAHGENEKQAPRRRLGFILSSAFFPLFPFHLSLCGSLTDHYERPYREHTGGHLWFTRIQMIVYEPCLAAKGQALSQCLKPLWLEFRHGVSLLVIEAVATIPFHFSCSRSWIIVLKSVLCLCLFQRTKKKQNCCYVRIHESAFVIPHVCVSTILFTYYLLHG